MLGSTPDPWWSYSRSRFVAMFRGELLIFGQRTSFDLPLRAEHLPFCECSFHSSVGSSVVDTCIKAMVGVAMCHPDVAPLTIKLAMNRFLVKRLMHEPAVPEELLCMDNVVLSAHFAVFTLEKCLVNCVS
ncbi:hypothetical protein BHE74_00006325 [Ensete ventricosum]|nr:hypothetical protein GW17_00033007 [Ensete ventricosum]RWW85035.1 hypothetical protein BHE74_00006325 [Ensete ventricosum]RZR80245.1 hypothetical protein BHM03_00006215 [Ensete ventricosum]